MLTQFHVSKLLKLSKSSRFLCSFVAFMLVSPVVVAENRTKNVSKQPTKTDFSTKKTMSVNKSVRAQSAERMQPKKNVCPPWPY